MKKTLLTALACIVTAFAQAADTPIKNGTLQSDLKANHYKIILANLADYAGANLTWNVTTNKFDASAGGGLPDPLRITHTPAGGTTNIGLILESTNAATSGSNKYAPAQIFTQHYYSSGDQKLDFKIEAKDAVFVFGQSSLNGGAWSPGLAYQNNGGIGLLTSYGGDSSIVMAALYGLDTVNTGGDVSHPARVGMFNDSTPAVPGIGLANNGEIWWDAGATWSLLRGDTGFNRVAAGVLKLRNVLQLTPVTTPGSPAEGFLYADSTDHKLYFRNNSAWIDLTAGASGVPATRTLTIAGTAFDLSANRTWTQDNITGLSATGLIKRTGANTLAIAVAGTDYVASDSPLQWDGGAANLVAATGRTSLALDQVTNDAQAKAAIYPNTAPSSGQIPVGNAGGTAYAKQTVSGSGATITLSSAGVITLSSIPNATLSNSAITIAGTSTSLGGSITQDTITGLGSAGLVKRTGVNTLAIATAGTDYLTGNQTITLSGDVTGSGATAITTTYNNVVPTTKAGLPTGGTANQVLSKIDATNYNTQWVTSSGVSVANPGAQLLGLTAINGSAATAMRSDGAPALSQAITPTWTGQHAWKFVDAATNTATNVLTVGHNSSGTPTGSYGTGILLQGKSDTTNDRDLGILKGWWSTATDGSRVSRMEIQAVNSTVTGTVAVFGGEGGCVIGTTGTLPTTDGIVNLKGIRISGSGTSGTFPLGNGTTMVQSAYAVPTTAGTKGTSNRSDGVNMVSSAVPFGVVTSTVDQTATAETAHVVYTVPANSAAAGTTYRVTAWGNMDNGTTAITFTPRVRWGGTAGTQLMATPTVVGTTTALTNKDWKAVAEVTIRTIGATGTAFCSMSVINHTSLTSGAFAADQASSGATGVTIDTTANKDLDITWTLSATTGTPHVRTLGGFVEIIN